MIETMCAVVADHPGGLDVLHLHHVPLPVAGPGQVRVAVRSAGINFHDVQQRRGTGPDSRFPLIPGIDFAGVVVEVGEAVEGLGAGQAVFGLAPAGGAYAQQAVVPAAAVRPIPDGVGFDEAAALPVAGLSASFLLRVSELRPGMTAAVFAAAGGLGCFLGGLLTVAGVRSIGITSSPAKAKIAEAAGHSDVIDYRAEDPVEAVRERTGGAGVDVVFDSVAGPEFARSFRMLRDGGTVICCGRAGGPPDLADVTDAVIGSRRNLGLRDFFLSTYLPAHVDELADRLDTLAEAMRSEQLRIPIRAFELGDAARAHALIESGSSVGKIVLHIDPAATPRASSTHTQADDR